VILRELIHLSRRIMPLKPLFKPRAIALTPTVAAVKAKGGYTSYILVSPTEESIGGYAVNWFRQDIYDLKWAVFLYPDEGRAKGERKAFVLSVTAPKKDELLRRVEHILATPPAHATVAASSEPLQLRETFSDVLALGGQREGGVH
jgi:hypothetical protein